MIEQLKKEWRAMSTYQKVREIVDFIIIAAIFYGAIVLVTG